MRFFMFCYLVLVQFDSSLFKVSLQLFLALIFFSLNSKLTEKFFKVENDLIFK